MNIKKQHLSHLPEMPEGKIPSWEATHTDICLCIPVFYPDIESEFDEIESWVAKSAAWSLYTWAAFSDAQEHGIPCWLYVEDTQTDHILPILERNNIPEENIKIADYSELKVYSKSLAPIFDVSLNEFQYVVVADADLFVIGKEDRRLPIFGNILENQPSDQGVSQIFRDYAPLPESKSSWYWLDRLYYVDDEQGDWLPHDVQFPKWLERVARLSTPEIAEKFSEPGQDFAHFIASLYCFNRDTLEDRKEFIANAAAELGDDEAVFAVYSKVFPEPWWELSEIDINHFDASDPEIWRLFYSDEDRDPCLFHYGIAAEYQFMKSINAINEE